QTPHWISAKSERTVPLDMVTLDMAYRLTPRVSEWREDGEILQVVGDINRDIGTTANNIVERGGSKIIELGKGHPNIPETNRFI
ncbi:hypothetical protein PFISCL1PPCAC_25442, partial [Pristionchus fissidentatus]